MTDLADAAASLDALAETARLNAERLLGGLGFEYLLAIWLFLATTLALAWVAWRLHYRATHGRGPLSFFAFLFPRAIYRHPSTWTDVQLVVVNQIFSPLSMTLGALATGLLASTTTHGLALVAPGHDPDFSWGFWPILAFTLALALVSDFATYVVHRLHHTVPALWELHKVHHSAEVMSPLTIFRKHPLFDLAARGLKAALLGPLQGLVFFAFGGPVDALVAFGANLVFSVFHMMGAGLRHSHVWLSYGPLLERLVISPAQHQIHHSRARRHWDRNFGQMFAVWDWMFGTLYVPKEHETLEFGVDDAPAREFSGLRGGLLRPIARALAVARKGARRVG